MFTSGNDLDQQVTKFIRTCIDNGLIVQIKPHTIALFCGPNDIGNSENKISIYECRRNNDFLKAYSNSKLKTLKRRGVIGISGDNKLALIITDVEGFDSTSDLIIECFKKNIKIQQNKHLIKNCMSSFKPKHENLKKILNTFPVTYTSTSMILNVNVESETYYKTHLVSIPKKHRLIYKDIEITMNPSYQIISLKLDGIHPNSDEHRYYCLGQSKFKLIDLDTINNLINRIKIWRLDDCYWIPDWI